MINYELQFIAHPNEPELTGEIHLPSDLQVRLKNRYLLKRRLLRRPARISRTLEPKL